MDIALFYTKQAFYEQSATKKRQMFCDAVHYLKPINTTDSYFLLAHCYLQTGKYKYTRKILDAIDDKTVTETICKNILLAHCHLKNRYSNMALSHLNACKNIPDNMLSAWNFAWALFYEYNSQLEFATSFCITAIKTIHLQNKHENDVLFYTYAVNENDLLNRIVTAYPDVRERTKLYHKNACMDIPVCDVAVHEYLNKNAIVTECRECGEQKSCTTYGYKYFCCVSCKMELQKGTDVGDCYKKCMELHPELEYPICEDVVKWKENSTEYIDWEIIYAGLRKNKKLIYQIKSCGGMWQTFEEYEKECYEHMMCQMFCMFGFYYDKHSKRNVEFQALNISIKYGKMIKNYGVLIKIMTNYQQIIDDFEHILDDDYLGTSSFISHQIAVCYSKLNDFQTASKYNKITLLKNGHCVGDFAIKDALNAVLRTDGIKSHENLILQYFNSGKITYLQYIKNSFKQHYHFWKILERTTNTHREIKKELENMRQIEKLKMDECIVCYEDCNEMVPMNCGHWYCVDCLKVLKHCAYRCDTNPSKN